LRGEGAGGLGSKRDADGEQERDARHDGGQYDDPLAGTHGDRRQ
jgi:hypothetical protein